MIPIASLSFNNCNTNADDDNAKLPPIAIAPMIKVNELLGGRVHK